MKRLLVILLIINSVTMVFAREKIEISGSVEWETFEIKSTVTLDLASAKIKLPAGRIRAESLLSDNFFSLIRNPVLGLQFDSSFTIAELIERGEFSLADVDFITRQAFSMPPFLSQDMLSMRSTHVIPFGIISDHNRPAPVSRTLNPVTTARYTGIIIIATEELPVHGMRSSQLPVPCLFPKIWDDEMNLIYERRMLETQKPMVRYCAEKSILYNSPSGLSPELQEIAGDRPLRVFAKGVFGTKPTDLIIDRNDALLIISSDDNRRLLSQGKVVFVLNDKVLKQEF